MCLYFMLSLSYIANLRLVVYVALLITFLSVFVIRFFYDNSIVKRIFLAIFLRRVMLI